MQWERGLPLGNGKMGCMLWGGGEDLPLIFSMDQAEVWDMRAFTPENDKTWTEYKELLAQGRGNEVDGFQYDSRKPHVTRVPVGRMEIEIDGPVRAHKIRLDLAHACCRGAIVTDKGEGSYETFICADRQLMVIRCRNMEMQPKWKLICRHGDYVEADTQRATSYTRLKRSVRMSDMLAGWGYPASREEERSGVRIISQDIPESGGFAVAWKKAGQDWFVSITHSPVSGEMAAQAAVSEILSGEKEGMENLYAAHAAWWEKYYMASRIALPDTRLEGYYYLQTYMLGSCTRPEGPHMTICGPWTDDNNLPPICANDYHWNNEQQMQVWSVYAGNRVEYGEPMLQMMEDNLANMQEACRLHFKTEGAFLAHCTDPLLRPTYMNVDNFELNGLPWICFHYWKRYLFTMDEDFLKNRAYPMMKMAAGPLLAELTMQEDGYYHLPWSSSPEYHGKDETVRWLKNYGPDWGTRFGPDATIDLALTRFLLGKLCEISEKLGLDEEKRAIWKDRLDKLAPYPLDEFGSLAVRSDVDLVTSHRHMSHLFPIYPLGEMTMANSGERINRCLDVLGLLGRGEWVGWTFPWVALIYTRAGRGAAARNLLLDYVDRYVTETGIHYQGPQGGCDVSLYGDANGLFGLTIEAQLGVPEAVHELLMRTENGVLRLFRDAPPAWAECACENMRAEGAFLITAARENYITRYVKVYSEKGGLLRLDTDLGEGELHGGAVYENGVYTAQMQPGETRVFWRGEQEPDTEFTPMPGKMDEDHFWGVKRVRRF